MYKSIAFFLLLITSMSTTAQFKQPLLFDFGTEGCGDCDWFVVVDGVMGGNSTGTATTHDKSISLSGTISLENNGGFSSIRSQFGDYDLTKYSRVKIRYRNQGHTFALTLNNHRRYFMPRYKFSLPDSKGEWREQVIAFKDFSKVRLGEVLGGTPTEEELSTVIRFGLISDEKKSGKFELDVDYIRFE